MTLSNWDELAEEYATRGFLRNEWVHGYQPLLGLLGDINGKRVLDYGCGSGKFTRVLAERGAEVIAVDPNAKMLALAIARNCRDIQYTQITANDVPYIHPIDSAVATYVFCGVKEDERIVRVMQQIYQRLKRTGSFFLLDPHPNSRQEGAGGKPVEVYLEGMSKPVLDYWRPVEKYVTFFQISGFTIDQLLEPRDEQGKPQMLILKGRKCTR